MENIKEKKEIEEEIYREKGKEKIIERKRKRYNVKMFLLVCFILIK